MLTIVIVCNTVNDVSFAQFYSIKFAYQVLIDVTKKTQSKIEYENIYNSNLNNFGKRKKWLIENYSKYDWILILDTDEVVSKSLLIKIARILKKDGLKFHGYTIRFKNFIFGKSANFGGENYSQLRLFNKKFATIVTDKLHDYVKVKGNIGDINSPIYHYSYRTPLQVLRKFTRYAWLVSEEKIKEHEKVTFKKLLLYGPHMVWARAIKDQGWRDGWRGIVLALFFGYMETLTYWLLLVRTLYGRIK
jgi:hypothetical protein